MQFELCLLLTPVTFPGKDGAAAIWGIRKIYSLLISLRLHERRAAVELCDVGRAKVDCCSCPDESCGCLQIGAVTRVIVLCFDENRHMKRMRLRLAPSIALFSQQRAGLGVPWRTFRPSMSCTYPVSCTTLCPLVHGRGLVC